MGTTTKRIFRSTEFSIFRHTGTSQGLSILLYQTGPFLLRFYPTTSKELAEKHYAYDSISVVADLAKSESDQLKADWPADTLLIIPNVLYPRYTCLRAWQVITRGAFIGIVETVRNRVLSFALEIEATNPDAGEAAPGSVPVAPEKVQQVFNNNFYGHVGNVATGATHFTQEAVLNVEQGDLAALRTRLLEIGISKELVTELQAALEEDKRDVGHKQIGPRAGAWIGKAMSTASSGVLKISTSAAATVLTKLICNYLGIPS